MATKTKQPTLDGHAVILRGNPSHMPMAFFDCCAKLDGLDDPVGWGSTHQAAVADLERELTRRGWLGTDGRLTFPS